jgi:hypothetical protein
MAKNEISNIFYFNIILRDGRPGFDSRQEKEIFLYSTASRPALGPPSPLLNGYQKRPGREAYHSPPPSAMAKNGRAIPSLPHTSSRRGAQSIKYRDNFTSLPFYKSLIFVTVYGKDILFITLPTCDEYHHVSF